jgi:hypothetical protein
MARKRARSAPAAQPLERQVGWERRLADLIAREMVMPFAWGEHDCATLAIAAVKAVTGTDIAAGVPPWFSPATAARALKAAGCASAEAFFSGRLEEIPVCDAFRGDLVYPAGPLDRLSCPAVLTGGEAMSRNEGGWVVMPRGLAVRAFRVGR